ncbi:MAG: sugar 3,4-ketoisomerase [Oligoflexia bacterium]
MQNIKEIEIRTVSGARGSLSFLQQDNGLPFVVRRIFYLHSIAPGQVRGEHAHREQRQFLIALSGRVTVYAESAGGRETYVLDRPDQGLLVEPLTWLKLTDFAPSTVCLVLCSAEYDEGDYLRNHDEFLNLIRSEGAKR